MSRFIKRTWRLPLSFKILVVALIPPAIFISLDTIFGKICVDPLACNDEDCHCPSDPNCPGKLKRAAAKLADKQ